ncbi:hypothetical protein [Actinomadura welshii]|uniref:hypothetical protein n=1 Tax=Actinomadura welshii TaxID=3103817 RepID=UPI0003AD3376|nr:hypothetical protein [Actinomadura madurae]
MEKQESPEYDFSDESADTGPEDRAPELRAPQFEAVVVLLRRHLLANLASLLVPTVLVNVALVILVGTVSLLVLNDRFLIIDGRLETYEATRGLMVAAFVAALVFATAHLAWVAMAVVVTAGSLLGRPLRPGRAASLVLRRSGSLLVLFTVLVVIAALSLMLAGFVAAKTGHSWTGLIVLGLVMVVLWRLPLTVATVVLEGTGPFKAFPRTLEIVEGRRGRMFVRLMAVVVALPLLPGACASWLVARVSGDELNLVQITVTITCGAVGAILQGTALTVVALDQWWPDEPSSAGFRGGGSRVVPSAIPLSLVTSQFSEGASVPRRRRARTLLLAALTLPALVAPGFLSEKYPQVNPQGIADLQEQPVRSDAVSHQILPGPLLGGGGALMWPTSGGRARLCADLDCTRSTSVSTFPGDVGVVPTYAVLPDGSWVFVQRWDKGSRGDQLKLRRCTAQGCIDPDEAPVLLSGDFEAVTVGITSSQRGALVAAFDKTERRDRQGTLHLLRCADLTCAESRTLTEVAVPEHDYPDHEQVVVAVGAGGRPVVAYQDYWSGAVTLLSCSDPDCRNTVVRHPVAPSSPRWRQGETSRPNRFYWMGGVEMAVPQDGRPVFVYRDAKTGSARFARCRTPDCATVDARTLTGRLPSDAPDLVLGPDGLPLIATFDTSRRRAVLIACKVADCSARDTVDLGAFSAGFLPGTLDVTVGRDGRPRVLWHGRPADGKRADFRTFLLTCREARCGA